MNLFPKIFLFKDIGDFVFDNNKNSKLPQQKTYTYGY